MRIYIVTDYLPLTKEEIEKIEIDQLRSRLERKNLQECHNVEKSKKEESDEEDEDDDD